MSRRDLWEPEGETPSGYPTSAPSSLCDALDVVYRSASDLKVQLRDRRQRTHMLKLEGKTVERARNAPTQALEQLADYGFAGQVQRRGV